MSNPRRWPRLNNPSPYATRGGSDHEDQGDESLDCSRYLGGYGAIAAKFGLSTRQVRERIHEAKQDAKLLGNPNVKVDEETGEIIVEGTDESIGSIYDESQVEKQMRKRSGKDRGPDWDPSVAIDAAGAGVAGGFIGLLFGLLEDAAPVLAAA